MLAAMGEAGTAAGSSDSEGRLWKQLHPEHVWLLAKMVQNASAKEAAASHSFMPWVVHGCLCSGFLLGTCLPRPDKSANGVSP